MPPKITKCANNHYYDAERYSQCPYCAPVSAAAQTPLSAPQDFPSDTSNNPTVSIAQAAGPTLSSSNKTIPIRAAAEMTDASELPDEQKTVGLFSTNTEKAPVVGWFVCTQGKLRGEDFRLKAGNNFIGRDKSMDVVLANDNTVSRKKHAILTYDPRSRNFIISAGESHELTYLNGQLLLDSKLIKAFDKVTLGSTELMFIPLCGENFSWDD